MPNDRAESAYRFRVEAAELARNREHPKHEANADEARYGTACYPMSFTKGLEHDEKTGLVANKADFEAFRTAIDNGFAEPFTTRVPVPRELKNPAKPKEGFKPRRQWEAPTAGTVFELEGPDPQAVTMPPAPELGSDELTYEMAEVYELALLRDVPFAAFGTKGGSGSGKINEAIARLNALPYDVDAVSGRPRMSEGGQITKQTAFRGSAPGAANGPYLSQLMLMGNSIPQLGLAPEDGRIAYGAQTINQRVLQAEEGDDYMMSEPDWLLVQNGFVPPNATRTGSGIGAGGQHFPSLSERFIHSPRDLATYVHIDALYQAYLNACLALLGQQAGRDSSLAAPFDPAFDRLSGMGAGVLSAPSTSAGTSSTYTGYNAGGFALWGGPHILSLVTEVATRGLKAVRYQKFNVHARLRPEALAARLNWSKSIDSAHRSTCCAFTKMHAQLSQNGSGKRPSTIEAVAAFNKSHSSASGLVRAADTVLLPMAFAEGSPMHPAYGAGHATVAGACVTILKAFFDTSAVLARIGGIAGFYGKSAIADAIARKDIEFGAFKTVENGKKLKWETYDGKCEVDDKGNVLHSDCCPLTLEGELNKLAANISIGRNMAGVHYFSDYFDSVRMGEEIAIGMLEEQALGYKLDPFVMSVPTFDGDTVRIGRR